MARQTDILACADTTTGELAFIHPHQRSGRSGRVVVARGNKNVMVDVRKACIRAGSRYLVPGVLGADQRLAVLLTFAQGVERRMW